MSMPPAHVDIAGYLFGMLDPVEYRYVEEHLRGCEACRREVTVLREMEDSLEHVPPELFLDGPDPDAELLLQRTLRAARAQSAPAGWSGGRWLLSAAAAVAVVVAVGGGIAIGRAGVEPTVVAGPSPSVSVTPAGTKVGSKTDPSTGATFEVTVTPATGWVRIRGTVGGVKEGTRCRMVVVGRDGAREVAGSWMIGTKAATEGLPVDGEALVAPDDVTAVEIVTTDGDLLVSVPV